MQLFQLDVFCRIVDRRGFTAAASELHVTQPAVSHHVRALEEELGTSLLVRQGRHVTPTAAGKILYRYASGILQAREKAVAEIRQLRSRPLVVAVTTSSLPGFVARIMQPLTDPARPGNGVVLRVDDHDRVLHGVLSGTIDLAITWTPVRTVRLDTEVLARETFRLVVAPDIRWLLPHDEIMPDALERLPFVVGRPGSYMRRCADEWLGRCGISPRPSLEAVSVADMKAAASRGIGVTFLPLDEVDDDIAHGRLRVLRCPALDSFLWRDVCLVLPPAPVSDAVRAVIDHLRASFRSPRSRSAPGVAVSAPGARLTPADEPSGQLPARRANPARQPHKRC